MAEIIFEALYKVFKVMMLMLAAFTIGWFTATAYTMGTLQVETMPDIDRIAVTNYLGNTDMHYMTPVERLVLDAED